MSPAEIEVLKLRAMEALRAAYKKRYEATCELLLTETLNGMHGSGSSAGTLTKLMKDLEVLERHATSTPVPGGPPTFVERCAEMILVAHGVAADR